MEVGVDFEKLRSRKSCYVYLPVVPKYAGGGSFKGESTYESKKEFAYAMCAVHSADETNFCVHQPNPSVSSAPKTPPNTTTKTLL